MNTTPEHFARLVAALLQPEAYPDPVERVELVETHISYLFLTGRHVYKVKKPVDFGFLDFTSLDQRRYYCEQEVAVNRRIAPQVYLGVVEIREQGERYAVDGPGVTVEYAVKMLQLPRDLALSVLLPQNRVSEQDIRRLAVKIAEFHRSAATGPEIVAEGGPSVLRQNVAENFQQTERYVGFTLSRAVYADLRAYSRAYLRVKDPVLRLRAEQGRVRDCHGDLHTAQIFLENGISIIDSIEFNHRFRYCDVALDLAFLAMDLDHFSHPELSDLLVRAYVTASDDPGVADLLAFGKQYRAYVRGKVTSFRLDHPEELSEAEQQEIAGTARSYFELAHSYLPVPGQPALFIFGGLMGSGKSTLSQRLARHWNLVYLSSDLIRKELAGLEAADRQYVAYGEGIYSAEFSRRTYEVLLERADRHLAAGQSVALDASFHTADARRQALDLGRRRQARRWLVECVASDAELRRRLERREAQGGAASDGRLELLQRQRDDWEPVREVPPEGYVRLDTSGSQEQSLDRLLQEIYARLV